MKKVSKAFISDVFTFYNKMVDTIELLENSCLDQVYKVKNTWRIQKNRQNDQTITLSAEEMCYQVCPVCSAA